MEYTIDILHTRLACERINSSLSRHCLSSAQLWSSETSTRSSTGGNCQPN